MKKQYLVHGLLEWQVNIPAGRIMIPVNFSGGRFSGYGITPASFATSDPVLQKAIEASSYFVSGRIKMRLLPDGEECTGAADAELSPTPQQRVDVPDLNSARQQLARLTNTPLGQLNTRASVEACARRHGIILKIGK